MKLGRKQMAGLALAAAGLAVLGGCNRRKGAEVNAIVPSVAVNRAKAPLGSAIEVTYTWTVEPTAKKLGQDYRALVHFLDSHGVLLFGDDHAPTPAPTSWEAGKTYSYTRTVFVPVYPYVGPVQVVMGLYPAGGKGERPALKGEDRGLREYVVGKMEFLPQTDNIFLVYKEGWHNPESAPHNPSLERTWTKKDALVSFKNPRKDIVVYLEADTNAKAFDAPPVLTLAVANKSGLTVPIENSEVFLRKVRVKAADLGSDEWVDLKLSMSESFVPKAKGVNTHDDRELGLMVYHLYVGEADALGTVPQVVDAGPITPGAMLASGGAAASKTAPAPKAPVKPVAGPAASK